MEPSFSGLEFSKNEILHYKPEFGHLSEGQDCILPNVLKEFLKGMRLSDHDVNKIQELTCGSQVKLVNFMSAMRLCSLVKQGKRYCRDDVFIEQKVLARRSRANEHKSNTPQVQVAQNKRPTKIQITDAELVQSGWFGASSYYIYKIHSLIQGQAFEVKRRFSELDWLHKSLNLQYKGLIIPDLPSKKIIKNTDSQFIQQRKIDMEEFLNSLKLHEVLGQCIEFLGFLKLEEIEFAKFKEDNAKEDWFVGKSIRETIDLSVARIETKLQGLACCEKNVTHSQYLRIEQEVTEKNENLRMLNECFQNWTETWTSGNSNFFRVLGNFQKQDEINTLLNKSESEMMALNEKVSQQSQKINTLYKTLFVYQESLEKKITASNLHKRKKVIDPEILKSEEELLKSLSNESEEILKNLHTEYKSINKSRTEQFPLVFMEVCKTQNNFISSIKSILTNVII